MEAVKAGADRQEMHEVIREHSMDAWAAIQAGQPNPLRELLAQDPRLTKYVRPEALDELLDATKHVGDAPERTLEMAAIIRTELGQRTTA